MPFIYHSSKFIKVNQIGTELQAECTLLNNDLEATAWVQSNVNTLKIQQAGWKVYRYSDSQTGMFTLPEPSPLSKIALPDYKKIFKEGSIR